MPINGHPTRIAIVGMGAVGASTAYVLIQTGHAHEVLLVDADTKRAEGHMMDLQHCLPWGRPIRMEVRSLDECEGCDMVLVTAGRPQVGHQTRMDLLKANAEMLGEIMPTAVRRNPDAIFAIVTNPVDVMARAAVRLSGLPPERVFGTGTVLDSARFRFLLSRHLDVDPRNVHAYVIGEHGDSEVVVWSRATVGPYTLDEYAAMRGRPLDDGMRADIALHVRRAAYEIIERKGATSFAIGVSTQRICESIWNDHRTIQTVSRTLAGAYGLGDVCMSLPCVLGRAGVERPCEIPLLAEERSALMRSAEILERAHCTLGL